MEISPKHLKADEVRKVGSSSRISNSRFVNTVDNQDKSSNLDSENKTDTPFGVARIRIRQYKESEKINEETSEGNYQINYGDKIEDDCCYPKITLRKTYIQRKRHEMSSSDRLRESAKGMNTIVSHPIGIDTFTDKERDISGASDISESTDRSHALTFESTNELESRVGSPVMTRNVAQSPTSKLSFKVTERPVALKTDEINSSLSRSVQDDTRSASEGFSRFESLRNRVNSPLSDRVITESDTSSRKDKESQELLRAKIPYQGQARDNFPEYIQNESKENKFSTPDKVSQKFVNHDEETSASMRVHKYSPETVHKSAGSPVGRELKRMIERLEDYNESVSPRTKLTKNSISPQKLQYAVPTIGYNVSRIMDTEENRKHQSSVKLDRNVVKIEEHSGQSKNAQSGSLNQQRNQAIKQNKPEATDGQFRGQANKRKVQTRFTQNETVAIPKRYGSSVKKSESQILSNQDRHELIRERNDGLIDRNKTKVLTPKDESKSIKELGRDIGRGNHTPMTLVQGEFMAIRGQYSRPVDKSKAPSMYTHDESVASTLTTEQPVTMCHNSDERKRPNNEVFQDLRSPYDRQKSLLQKETVPKHKHYRNQRVDNRAQISKIVKSKPLAIQDKYKLSSKRIDVLKQPFEKMNEKNESETMKDMQSRERKVKPLSLDKYKPFVMEDRYLNKNPNIQETSGQEGTQTISRKLKFKERNGNEESFKEKSNKQSSNLIKQFENKLSKQNEVKVNDFQSDITKEHYQFSEDSSDHPIQKTERNPGDTNQTQELIGRAMGQMYSYWKDREKANGGKIQEYLPKNLDIQSKHNIGSQTVTVREDENVLIKEQSSQTRVHRRSYRMKYMEDNIIDINNDRTESSKDRRKTITANLIKENGHTILVNRRNDDDMESLDEEFHNFIRQAIPRNVHLLQEDIKRVLSTKQFMSSKAYGYETEEVVQSANEADDMLRARIETLLSLCDASDDCEYGEPLKQLLGLLQHAFFDPNGRPRDHFHMDEMNMVLKELTDLLENEGLFVQSLSVENIGETSYDDNEAGNVSLWKRAAAAVSRYFGINCDDNYRRQFVNAEQELQLNGQQTFLKRILHIIVLCLKIITVIAIVLLGPSAAKMVYNFVVSCIMYVMRNCSVRLIQPNPPIT